MLSQCHLFVFLFILFINHVSLSTYTNWMILIFLNIWWFKLSFSKYDLFLFINVYKNQNAIKDCIQNCH
jgi:hypothetical protein